MKSDEGQRSNNASAAAPCLINQLPNRIFWRKQCGEASRKYLSRHSHIMRRRCKGGSVGARVRRPERFSARVGGIAFAVCFRLAIACLRSWRRSTVRLVVAIWSAGVFANTIKRRGMVISGPYSKGGAPIGAGGAPIGGRIGEHALLNK